jgi:adenylate cyclase
MTEIERKFLVASEDFKSAASRKTTIKQGYLNSDPDRTVRVRLRDSEGFLTVKGRSSEDGLSRFEWEKEINSEEAEELLKLCEPGMIEKIRYEIEVGKHIFEVDEFLGENEGLLLAEVELSSETEEFQKPSWLGPEVTGDLKYYNSYLIKKPYNSW